MSKQRKRFLTAPFFYASSMYDNIPICQLSPAHMWHCCLICCPCWKSCIQRSPPSISFFCEHCCENAIIFCSAPLQLSSVVYNFLLRLVSVKNPHFCAKYGRNCGPTLADESATVPYDVMAIQCDTWIVMHQQEHYLVLWDCWQWLQFAGKHKRISDSKVTISICKQYRTRR